MFKMNQKGQEFSVFKLLISAIVAIAILGILITLLNPDWFNPKGEPSKIAENVLRNADKTVYQEFVSDEVVFGEDHTISSRTLGEELDLERQQVCLTLLEDLESKGFAINGEKSLISYSRDTSSRVKIVGLCGPKDSFVSDNLAGDSPKLTDGGFDFSSECGSVCPDGQKCCVLALIKS